MEIFKTGPFEMVVATIVAPEGRYVEVRKNDSDQWELWQSADGTEWRKVETDWPIAQVWRQDRPMDIRPDLL